MALEGALKLTLQQIKLLHRLCAALIKLGRYKAVVDAAGKALAIDPTNALSHNNQGVALQALNRTDEAKQGLSQRPRTRARLSPGSQQPRRGAAIGRTQGRSRGKLPPSH